MKLEHYQALAYAIETDSNLKFENYQLGAEKCINELRRKIQSLENQIYMTQTRQSLFGQETPSSQSMSLSNQKKGIFVFNDQESENQGLGHTVMNDSS